MTVIIIFIYYSDLISRVTLSTLNVLNILTDLKAEMADPPPDPNRHSSMILKITTSASKMFILSLKYSMSPSPTTLSPMSTVKIIVKA